MTELETVTTEDLLTELISRFDYGVICMYSKLDEKTNKRVLEHWGGTAPALGAALVAQRWVEAALFNETDTTSNTDDFQPDTDNGGDE